MLAGSWREERKLPWLPYFLFLFEAWSLQENQSGGMIDGIQMNYDEQASFCHSCKPRGHEVRKSSNQVISVLFLFLPSVRAAGGWKGSGVIYDEWQHTLLQPWPHAIPVLSHLHQRITEWKTCCLKDIPYLILSLDCQIGCWKTKIKQGAYSK